MEALEPVKVPPKGNVSRTYGDLFKRIRSLGDGMWLPIKMEDPTAKYALRSNLSANGFVVHICRGSQILYAAKPGTERIYDEATVNVKMEFLRPVRTLPPAQSDLLSRHQFKKVREKMESVEDGQWLPMKLESKRKALMFIQCLSRAKRIGFHPWDYTQRGEVVYLRKHELSDRR